MKRNRPPASPAILGKGAAHTDKRPSRQDLDLNEGITEYEEFKEKRAKRLQALAIQRIINDDMFE